MRNAKLTILAALSLVTLAILVCGCFATASLQFRDYTINNATVFHRQGDVMFQDARSIIDWVRYTVPLEGKPVALYRSSWSKFLTPSMPRMRPALWGFDIGFYHGTRSGFVFTCPNWFLALPCTIAPIAWLRRRRRRELRGFAVEQSQPSQPASEQPNQPPELPTDRQTPT